MKTLKHTTIKATIPVLYLKEGEAFICYSPALDLVAHGDSFEDAEHAFSVSLKLFIEYVSKKGTWEQVLTEYGWEKVKQAWTPPRIISHQSREIDIPIAA